MVLTFRMKVWEMRFENCPVFDETNTLLIDDSELKVPSLCVVSVLIFVALGS
jgi:hypothetical protein